jgi:predicted DNA-binding WGR domain protein
MDWENPPPGFQYILFELINPHKNMRRFYYLGFQATLIDESAVVRFWGRIGGQQRHLSPQPFASLEEAWPLLRSIIRARLRHGYRVVRPEEFAESGDGNTPKPT